MAEVLLSSSPTELWYPYGEPGKTHVCQDHASTALFFADNENYLANSTDTPRPDRAVTGS